MNLLELSQNKLLAIFYIWGNLVSFVVAFILYIKSFSMKQTRTNIFKIILNIFMIYFMADSVWALAYFEILNHSNIIIKIARMIYYVDACFLALAWFIYVSMSVDKKITKRTRHLLFIPISLSIIITVVLCILSNPAAKNYKGYLTAAALILIPLVFIVASGVIAFSKRLHTTDESMKKVYNALSIWPIVMVIVSVLQVLFSEIPIFCFGAIVVTLSLYVYNQESLIFTDALTGINNRNMLNKYTRDIMDKECFIFMIDVDDFKHINDNYGHLEGDKALKYIANVLKNVCSNENSFLARYGGDEFILISHKLEEAYADTIKAEIDKALLQSNDNLGYNITVSIGYCKKEANEKISIAISKADEYLYKHKKDNHKGR